MLAVLANLFTDDAGHPTFRITFRDTRRRRGPFKRRHQFTVNTPRGTVTLEPLAVSFEALFGMLSVFPSDIVGAVELSRRPPPSPPTPLLESPGIARVEP